MNPNPRVSPVTITVIVHAAPEVVFRYFTDAARLSRWLNSSVRLDPEVGGRLRIDFSPHQTVVSGELLEVIPERRVVFSWGVESGPGADAMPPGSTMVAVTLEPAGSGTLVTLDHSGLPDESERHDHEGGWREYLTQLVGVVAEEGQQGRQT